MVKKTLELEILGLACDTEDDVGPVLYLVDGLTNLVRVAIIGSLECPFPSRWIPGRGVTGFYLWHCTTMLYDILSWLVLIRVLTYTLVIVNLI